MSEKVSRDQPLDYLKSYKEKSLGVMQRISEEAVAGLISLLADARKANRQIFLCGNGGSASTASHFANDLGKGASWNRDDRFRVLALTDNVSWITALANDTDYSQIFVEQLKNYASPDDVLIAFSGSRLSAFLPHDQRYPLSFLVPAEPGTWKISLECVVDCAACGWSGLVFAGSLDGPGDAVCFYRIVLPGPTVREVPSALRRTCPQRVPYRLIHGQE